MSRHGHQRAYRHLYINVYRHVQRHVYRHVDRHLYRHVHQRLYRHAYRHVPKHVYRHVYGHACIPVCPCTYTPVRMPSRRILRWTCPCTRRHASRRACFIFRSWSGCPAKGTTARGPGPRDHQGHMHVWPHVHAYVYTRADAFSGHKFIHISERVLNTSMHMSKHMSSQTSTRVSIHMSKHPFIHMSKHTFFTYVDLRFRTHERVSTLIFYF